MFQTDNIKMYLMDSYPTVDGDKRLIQLRCYVNPIDYELTSEVDIELARTLFHLVGQEWMPRPLLQSCKFNTNLPPYALNFCRDPEHGNHHVHIPVVKICKLEAGKVTPESNAWALMFTLSFEKNDPKWLNDFADLLHEHFYGSFTQLQPGLFDEQDPVMDLLCRLCDAPNPEFATTDGKFVYCTRCSANKEGGEKLRRIRDTAAAEAIAHEENEEPVEAPRKDPLLSGADVTARSRNRRRGSQALN